MGQQDAHLAYTPSESSVVVTMEQLMAPSTISQLKL